MFPFCFQISNCIFRSNLSLFRKPNLIRFKPILFCIKQHLICLKQILFFSSRLLISSSRFLFCSSRLLISSSRFLFCSSRLLISSSRFLFRSSRLLISSLPNSIRGSSLLMHKWITKKQNTVYYFTPVLPNPPSPLTVSDNSVTNCHSARSCFAIINWAIRSPF